MVRIASRMDRLGSEGAFVTLAKARELEAEGREIIHLEIGEPDFPTPDNIVESAVGAIHAGYTHYTPAAGLLAAREAVAGFVSRHHNQDIDPRQVVLTPGTKNIVHFTLLACVEPGEEVIYQDPGYPAYQSLVEFQEAVPVRIPVREDRDFRLDVEELARLITPRSRLLIINSPQNPTGGVLTPEDVAAVADLARRYDLLVLSDEIYAQLTYDDYRHVSVLSEPGMMERTVLMDGLSKSYAMTGWRLGWAVAPVELAEKLDLLMMNTSACAAAFTQVAAIEALESPDSERAVCEMVKRFERRRNLLVAGLNRIPGFRCAMPKGAFYAFPNIEGTGMNENDLATNLLTEAGVALLPGTAFGPSGRGHLRLSYANSEENIVKALERIDQFVRSKC